ncbi:MAG: hypothetical protein NTZ22_00615 [Hyphomicrobiales bacterium]|nr:hypothetical protein [Hyphomicrobiales bacterium]
MQSRLMSMVEAIVNVLVGFWVAVLSQMLVFPLFDLQASFSQNIGMGLIFTVVSFVRSYLLRRFCNALQRPERPAEVAGSSS